MRSPRTCSRTFAACLAVIALTPMFGCQDLRRVKLLISDYASADVKGVTIWNWDPEAGGYVPQSVFRFGDMIDVSGTEYVQYRVADDRIQIGFQLAAPVTRDPANPQSLIVQLSLLRSGTSSLVRASTFNAVGESSLSDEVADLTS